MQFTNIILALGLFSASSLAAPEFVKGARSAQIVPPAGDSHCTDNGSATCCVAIKAIDSNADCSGCAKGMTCCNTAYGDTVPPAGAPSGRACADYAI